MALNGSDWISDPFNTTFSPFTDFFSDVLGVAGVFWLVPILVLCMGIYYKTENPTLVSMFMIGSGALFASGNIFVGSPEMALVFTVFTALGFTGLIASLLYQRD